MIPSLVVTTWPGGAVYGKTFLRTWDRYWQPLGIPLSYRSEQWILRDPEVVAFRERELARKDYRDKDIHKDVLTWSWKVFALTMEPVPTEGWMLWIDGDVEFTATPTEEWFDKVCPEDADVTYLGRPWAYASETGFVGYRMPQCQPVLEMLRSCYLKYTYRDLGTGSDGKLFDYCLGMHSLRRNNLSAHCQPPNLHVVPQTILGDCLIHNKGPMRKKEAYGTTS